MQINHYQLNYNLLNLPSSIERFMDGASNIIDFNYTSVGSKPKEHSVGNGSINHTRYYAGPFTFLGTGYDPAYFTTPYGRFGPKSSSWRHETHLRNHLGNTRLAYIHEGTTINKVQETHYYPFGMRISPLSNQPLNLDTERNNANL